MNVVTNKLELKANGWIDLVDVTQIADDFIKNSPIKDGMLNLYCQDAKSALITTEYEMDLVMDTADFIAKLVDGVKEHAKPQIASSFLGQAINIPIKDNRLNLGTWQQVIFVDLGQAGNKELMLQAVGI